MATHHSSMAELRKMDREELLRESKSLSHAIAKARMGLEVKKEKDSASYKRDRTQYARVQTALNSMPAALPKKSPTRKLSR